MHAITGIGLRRAAIKDYVVLGLICPVTVVLDGARVVPMVRVSLPVFGVMVGIVVCSVVSLARTYQMVTGCPAEYSSDRYAFNLVSIL